MLNIWHISHPKHNLTPFIKCSKCHIFCNMLQYPQNFGMVRTKCGIWFIIFLFEFSLSSYFFNWFFLSPHNLSLSPNRCSLLKTNPKIFFLLSLHLKTNSNSQFKTKPRNGIITNPKRIKESAMEAR